MFICLFVAGFVDGGHFSDAGLTQVAKRFFSLLHDVEQTFENQHPATAVVPAYFCTGAAGADKVVERIIRRIGADLTAEHAGDGLSVIDHGVHKVHKKPVLRRGFI